MKKQYYIPLLVAAALVSCSKVITPEVKDSPIDDNLIHVEGGISFIASAELTKVLVNTDSARPNPSYMTWEADDMIVVYHKGNTYDYKTATAGESAVFQAVSTPLSDIDPDSPIIAYYNVSSVSSTDGKATFSVPAVQTEGDATNKVPLYAYSATPVYVDDHDGTRLKLTFNPMASVLEFQVSAGITTTDSFSYNVTKVVLTPKDGAEGWTTMSGGTFNPDADGGVITPASEGLNAITLNFASSTDIAAAPKRFQMIVGPCRLENTGATMDWYKGDILNYTKAIWAAKDINLTGEYKHIYQPIAKKVVGIANYSDYYSKFYGNRSSQANFINYCDDEGTMILTGDVIMTGSSGNRSCCFSGLTWNFDGKGHYLYQFDVDNDASGQNRIYGFFSNVQADIKNVNFGGKNKVAAIDLTDSQDSRGARAYGAITDVASGSIENVTSYINYTLTLSKTDNHYFIGGVVGYMSGGSISGCHNRGTITVTQNTTAQQLYVGGVVGYANAAAVSVSDSQNHANVAVTKNGTGPVYAGGVIGHHRGVSISDCQNDATSLALTMSGTGQIFTGGILGSTGSEVMTMSGLVNSANVSVTRSNFGDAYTGGIVGQPWCGSGTTLSGCENQGNISFESTYDGEHDTQWKTGGLAGRFGSSQGIAVSNCINSGDVTADADVAPNTASKYTVGGLIADFQAGSTMSNCTQRGSVVYIKTNGEYVATRACWLAAWTVLDNVTATPSASVLKGITVNGVTVDESNYAKKNIWAPQNSPSSGVLTLITE